MIEVVDLTKRFRDFTAVDHISFEVSAGEIFRFLGPNGAGKTTAIMMLTTLLRPSGGRATVCGLDENVRKLRRSKRSLCKDIAIRSTTTGSGRRLRKGTQGRDDCYNVDCNHVLSVKKQCVPRVFG